MNWLAGGIEGFDPFFFFRRILVIFATLYSGLILARAGWRWFKYLYFPDRSRQLLRRYLFIQLMRVRLRRFGGDLLQIAGLLAIMGLVIWLHRFVPGA
ncbi:MAG: hypothetical protein GXY33_00475 [Phycisphaerae bacterium]|nr:hypothetical protein [Phycisphaerae bacterium]